MATYTGILKLMTTILVNEMAYFYATDDCFTKPELTYLL